MKIKIFNYTIRITKNKKWYQRKKYKSKVWSPPSAITAPDAPDGYRHRWIRVESIGYRKRLRSGFFFFLGKRKSKYPVISEGRYKGYIGVGGLVLAKVNLKRMCLQ